MKTKTDNLVYKLRQTGYKVRVIHERNMTFLPIKWKWLAPYYRPGIAPRGGRTIVQIRHPNGREVQGVAKCCNQDSYNRKLGVQLATERALAKFETGEKK